MGVSWIRMFNLFGSAFLLGFMGIGLDIKINLLNNLAASAWYGKVVAYMFVAVLIFYLNGGAELLVQKKKKSLSVVGWITKYLIKTDTKRGPTTSKSIGRLT